MMINNNLYKKEHLIKIGKRLAEIRNKAEMNQHDFADFIDVSVSTIKNIERGAIEPPLDLIVKLVKIYFINPNYFLFGIEEHYLTKQTVEVLIRNEFKF